MRELPAFCNVAPGCVTVNRVPPGIPMRGLILQFGGKRMRAADVRRVRVVQDGWTVWEGAPEVVKMLARYLAKGTKHRYCFIELAPPGLGTISPGVAGGGGRELWLEVELGPECIAPRMRWWSF